MSNEIKTRPLTPTEQKYTYAQSMQLEGQTGTIGHLRGDFATTGYGFYTTLIPDLNGNLTNLRQTLIRSSMLYGRIKGFCITAMI
jgi:hypothetical protein